MRLYLLTLLFSFSIQFCKGQDTLVIADSTRVLVKVLLVDDYGISYLKLENILGRKYHMELTRALMIKYESGRVDVLNDFFSNNYWREHKALSPFGDEYELLIKKYRAWTAPGAISVRIGPPIGFGCLPASTAAAYYLDYTPNGWTPYYQDKYDQYQRHGRRLWRGMWTMVGISILCGVSGPIELIEGGIYKHKANKIKRAQLEAMKLRNMPSKVSH